MAKKKHPKKKESPPKTRIRAWVIVVAFLVVVGIVLLVGPYAYHQFTQYQQNHNTKTSNVAITAPVVSTSSIPTSKILEDGYFVSQTFNNCGPSALSMDLSYYGVHVSQETLADDLRPDA